VKIRNYHIDLTTNKGPSFINITDAVQNFIKDSGVKNGYTVVYSKHTTAAIKINEDEPLLIKDMEVFLEKLASRDSHYHHNDFSIRTVNMTENEGPNGHAHCQHLLLGTSESIPIMDSKMQLGQWQSIFFVELDTSRQREVLIQVVGE
jgi:secondary thiamine-phosphate synthase enzyme